MIWNFRVVPGRLPGYRAIAAVWLLLFGCSLALYTPFLNAGYYLDDLLFFFAHPPAHLADYLFLPGSAIHLYRPAEAMILTLVQAHFGMSTWPLHLVAIAAHASLCCMVWVAALFLRFRKFEAVLACILMLVTQMGAPALLGNDTLSQSASAALGVIACLLLCFALFGSTRIRSQMLFAGSVFCYFLSLFFKETALGFSLLIALLSFLAALREGSWASRIRFFALRVAPYFVGTLVYFALRVHAGMPLSGSGEYRVSVGSNVAVNLIQFLVVAVSPVSSVTFAILRFSGESGILVAACISVVIVLSILIAGIFRISRKALLLFLAACIFAALFPAVLLQHVSELYVYNAAPAIALLFALSLGALWDRGSISRLAVMLCAVFLIGGQAAATRQKAAMMNANGQAEARMLATIAGYMRQMPPQSELVLTQEKPLRQRYSVYVLPGIEVLDIGNDNMGLIYGRPDVKVRLVPKTETPSLPAGPHRLILELKDGVLTPMV